MKKLQNNCFGISTLYDTQSRQTEYRDVFLWVAMK